MWDFPKYKPSSYWPTRSSSMPWSFVTWNRSSSCPRLSLALLCISSRLFTLGSLAEGNEHVRTLWDDVGWYGLFFWSSLQLAAPKIDDSVHSNCRGQKKTSLPWPFPSPRNTMTFHFFGPSDTKKPSAGFASGTFSWSQNDLSGFDPPPNRGWVGSHQWEILTNYPLVN